MLGSFPQKIKKVLQLLMLLRIFLKESYRKSNKIWVNKGSEFYNK